MFEISIKIKKRHIRLGKPMSRVCCPIALALKDQGYKDPVVDWNRVSTTCGRIKLPDPATDFIQEFDRLKKVKPLAFEAEWTPWRNP